MYHCVFFENVFLCFLVMEIYIMFGSQHHFICQQASNHFKKKRTKEDQSSIFSNRVLTIFNKHMVPKAEHQVHKQKQFRGLLLLYWIEDCSFGTHQPQKTKRVYFFRKKTNVENRFVSKYWRWIWILAIWLIGKNYMRNTFSFQDQSPYIAKHAPFWEAIMKKLCLHNK